ncbi:hypothetical protein HMN09_01299800 [Mycena chlorophos]|uniref:Uncharacterized protein n=1 Tax=Mycena chlorophos TaxID=658473 RepID=A0A8H6VQL3_MYCCL|nr:hypothetical protein HMN09_01299800 [Mycena chlorophos]
MMGLTPRPNSSAQSPFQGVNRLLRKLQRLPAIPQGVVAAVLPQTTSSASIEVRRRRWKMRRRGVESHKAQKLGLAGHLILVVRPAHFCTPSTRLAPQPFDPNLWKRLRYTLWHFQKLPPAASIARWIRKPVPREPGTVDDQPLCSDARDRIQLEPAPASSNAGPANAAGIFAPSSLFLLSGRKKLQFVATGLVLLSASRARRARGHLSVVNSEAHNCLPTVASWRQPSARVFAGILSRMAVQGRRPGSAFFLGPKDIVHSLRSGRLVDRGSTGPTGPVVGGRRSVDFCRSLGPSLGIGAAVSG